MRSVKKWWHKIRLSFLFAAIFFLIMLLTIVLVFLGMFLLHQIGIGSRSDFPRLPLFVFAVVSLSVGTVLAAFLSRRPLSPLRSIMEATDQIANGDYSARLSLKGPEEIRQMGESFNHMAQELGSVEMLRNDFVNNFSHEFKTPIVSIRGFAKMLKRNDLTPGERDEYLDIIITESERLAELATNVLNLSKIEEQTIVTDRKRFNVSEQIRLVITLLDSKWHKKQIEFSCHCDEVFVNGNEELLKQVWINLIDNAIKFSPDHGRVEIWIAPSGQKILFTVFNQGESITKETAAHIFDKFFQGDASHTTKGNGLGLTIAKKIIELHGGAIRVNDQIENGTAFDVELPVE